MRPASRRYVFEQDESGGTTTQRRGGQAAGKWENAVRFLANLGAVHPRPHWRMMLACPGYRAYQWISIRCSQKNRALDFILHHSNDDDIS